MHPLISRHVAVIGAGPAGLVAARELRLENHTVVVFERQNQIGGTWVYTNEVECDPLGLDPGRPIIHSSLYDSLRTNFPRELMGYRDYPYMIRPGGPKRDPRRFPGHEDVLVYLQEFAREFMIEEMVRFETEVVRVCLVDEGKWKIRFQKKGREIEEEIFDAVVVCNGHYSQPRLAEIQGIDAWPGKQIHSHSYRTPEPYHAKVVIVIGSSFSAIDISRELAGAAKEVHIASRSVADETYEKQQGYDNIWCHSKIKCAREDGTVAFQNGKVILADVILHCTGYNYHYPFLESNGIVTVEDNRVGPLYKHVFPPSLAPWLSFVGIPWRVAPFPLSEHQSKWIAGVLSGRILLPSQKEMMDDVESFYVQLQSSAIPKRYTHKLGAEFESEYNNWLADQCGYPRLEDWRKEMHKTSSKNKHDRPENFRDEWDDDHLVLQANQDFLKYTSN